MSGPIVPFPIVVLGDSIQWGQGLLETQKMAELVAAALVNEFGPQLTPQVVRFAQSGATIDIDGQATTVAALTPFPQGEVPSNNGEPTLFSQVNGSQRALATNSIPLVRISPSSVQLVILDGGINDVGLFTTILNPFASTGEVSAEAAAFCGGDSLTIDPNSAQFLNGAQTGQMSALLAQVASAYPNAVIAVTGYYPILSVLSDPIGLLFTVGLLADVPNVDLLAPNGWLAGMLTGNGDVNAVLLQIANQCDVFKRVSDEALGSAVDMAITAQQAAAATGVAGRFMFQGQLLSRFIFVPSPITDVNALFVGGSDGADEIFPTSPALLWGFNPAPAGINSVVLSFATAGGIFGSLGGFLAGLGEFLATGDLGGLLTAVASGSVALSLAGALGAIVEIESEVGAVDEVAGPRQAVCGGDPVCNLASVGHPNIEGEVAYANALAAAIIPTFEPLLRRALGSDLAFLTPLLFNNSHASPAPLLLSHPGASTPLLPDNTVEIAALVPILL